MSLAERLSRDVTRRTFLQAMGLAFAGRITNGFTAIADELDRLMRWCSCNSSGLRFAGAG